MVIFISQRYHCEIIHTLSKLINSYLVKPKLFTTLANSSSLLGVLPQGCVSVRAGPRRVCRPNAEAESWREAQRNRGPGRVAGFQPSLGQPEEGRGHSPRSPRKHHTRKFVSWSAASWTARFGGHRPWRQAACARHPLGSQSRSVSAPDWGVSAFAGTATDSRGLWFLQLQEG